jgi:hypothetical protein
VIVFEQIEAGREWIAWFFVILLVIAAIIAFTTWWGDRKR